MKSGAVFCAQEGLGNIHFLQADMYTLPFVGETFDFIFFSTYGVAGERRFELLHRVREILRPGGMVMIVTVTPLHLNLHGGSLLPNIVMRTEDEMVDEIAKIERCRFRFHECCVDPTRREYRFAIFEAY